MAQITHVPNEGRGQVVCSGIDAHNGQNLRCRFGTVDVPCVPSENGHSCVPPPEDSDTAVLLQVLNNEDVCLAQDQFHYPPKPAKVMMEMAACCRGGTPNCCQKDDQDIEMDKVPDLPELGEQEHQGGDEELTASALLKGLSWVDRLLPVWIIGAMILGVLLGYYTNIEEKLDVVKIDSVSLPIAVGLWMMMWPVLCKVRYELLGSILRERGVWVQLLVSLVMNWLVGPLLMTGLAWATLPDLDNFRNGVIMVGIARCIAMVLIWNQMAMGSPEYCAILVSVNSILQCILFAPLSIFYLQVVSRQYLGDGQELHINFWQVCRSVLIYLGAPLVAGIVTRYTVIALTSREWFEKKFMAWFGPLALIALVYTIIIIFALQGRQVIDEIGDVCRVAVPMLLYFSIMWTSTVFLCRHRKFSYEHTVTQAFTASSNNFELAIAIAVGTFGVHSQEALAATVGPLIEVPALLALVYVALYLRKRLGWEYTSPRGVPDPSEKSAEMQAV